jgi:N utilization substance protein A
MVVSELRGEKIDIIPYNEEPARFVAKALSPARVREVLVDDEEMQATVVVPDDQLSLAIGRDGQNARLAARLTGWRVDIKSESDFAREESEHEYEGDEEFDGRCMAILSSGRRCPNAAVSGSTYCQLPQHQALSRFSTSHVGVLAELSDEDIALLADPDADETAVGAIVAGAEADFVEPSGEEEVAPEEAAVEEAEAEVEADEQLVEEAEAEIGADDRVADELVAEEDSAEDAAAEEETGEELAAAEEAEAEAELEAVEADPAPEEAEAVEGEAE